jgi:chorismate mutase-like protein
MEILKPYRRRIDALDDQIIDLLAQRLEIIDEVAELKAARDIPAVLEDRVNEVIDRVAERAAEKGVDPELARRLYAVLVAWCCETEEAYIKSGKRKLYG